MTIRETAPAQRSDSTQSPDATTPAWHALPAGDALRHLEVSTDGLSADEAADRLATYGRNELPITGRRAWWYTLIKQFFSPVIGLLLIAAVISAIEQHWVDAVAIMLVLIINASLGFWQERKAEADVQALASLSTPHCRVLRDGQEIEIEAPEAVPGDIVLLESGERVPADLRILDANALSIDESMLTGESVAASKGADPVEESAVTGDRTSVAFSGTLVTRGRGRGVVTATGAETELGEINELVQGPVGKTPLQILTHSLERRIGAVVVLAVVFLFIVGIVLGHDSSDMFRTAVALAVASIPESLPIVLTVAMSVGVSRMAQRNAVLRTLPSVETLGSTNVIGSDKTGTLTQNVLTVERLWTATGEVDLTGSTEPEAGAENEAVRAVLRAGALTNESAPDADGNLTGDAVDVAMARVALQAGVVSEAERAAGAVAEMPYEPDLRYSQTVREEDGRRVLYVKGSPDTLVEMSSTLFAGPDGGALDPEAVLTANEQMATGGTRWWRCRARCSPVPTAGRSTPRPS